MGLGTFFCRIGLHDGKPMESADSNSATREEKGFEEVRRRVVKCVRCGKEYAEVTGLNPTWYGHP